jgi:hypothetical protein
MPIYNFNSRNIVVYEFKGILEDLNPTFDFALKDTPPSSLVRFSIEFSTDDNICKCILFAEWDRAGVDVNGFSIDFPKDFSLPNNEHPLQPIIYLDNKPYTIEQPRLMISAPTIACFIDSKNNEYIGLAGLYVVSGALKFVMKSFTAIDLSRVQACFEWQKYINLYSA